MKTIDIHGKEWFDKTYGNSYFSAQATIDFGLPTQKTVLVPFQYGYGSSFEYEAMRQMQMDGLIPDGTIYSPSRYCADNGIVLRSHIDTKCLKSAVKAWGSK